MLQFIDIKHQYASAVLFDGFSWHIKPGSRVCLVGPNGSGKSTLFRIAEGKFFPDSGSVAKSKNTEISIFQQIPDFDPEAKVIDTALAKHKHYKEYSERLNEINGKFDSISHDSKEFTELLDEQSSLEEYAFTYGVHELESKARKVLGGLGFSNAQMEMKVREFSPGYQHRLGLAITLLNPGNLLLLDEPTNHLDNASKQWLADYLNSTGQSFVLVTHDPEFLNATCDTIAELSPSGVIEFRGTLEEYFEHKNELQEKLQAQYDKEESYLKKRMEWIERFRAKATKARQVQSAIKKLEKRDKVEAPEESFWNSKSDYQFNFISSGKITARIEDGAFSYSGKPPYVFSGGNLEISAGDKIAVVGPNGAGKSTFLRCLLEIHKLTSGKIYYGPKTKIGYFSQNHHEELDPSKNLLQTVMGAYPDLTEQQARSLLGYFSFSDDSVYKQTGLLSGGEQSRLRLALLVRFPTNSIFLDEPTNHLDLVVRDNLRRALMAYEGSLLIISHDPEFLKDLCNRTISVDQGQIRDFNCSFADYLKYNLEETAPSKMQNGNGSAKKEDGQQTRSKKNADKNRIKKIQKDLEQIEAKIELLEKSKKNLEEVLADPGFFKNRSYQLELDNFNEAKNEIARLTSEWESLQLELEELTGTV
ncbi:ABC-F family ATP-binding cassette domain-containing protein [Leptospira sp. FAT2]|uniref:ABC-F family ATP-binding cassette domain-containing protein n=1 Tax=Leptospira sanjuanensis TaxID=2879643 RepID=UPI001EE7FCE7|nr:ABC-F family ATP-binding cassette domain-containing protein [Leptospira sanjuanensis]MCG6169399.1 ABC-F family ATP-binding cassette domain-containing protein [Leptospira sanjuanensis]MCG6194799.1 ABC-F family ATP-binding cassette domain-containing protein [Leptospira sanjuanensis]